MQWTNLNLPNILDLYKGREYHNLDHLASMYNYLNTQEIEYSKPLDYAILFHDAVYDDLPNKELRSLRLFNIYSLELPITREDINWVSILIKSTISHNVILNLPLEHIMIQADLCDLLSLDKAIINREKIRLESKRLYGIDDDTFYKANSEFMLNLAVTMLSNMSKSHWDSDKEFYSTVAENIRKLIKI